MIQKLTADEQNILENVILAYYDDRWYFMGKETKDPAVVLGCLLGIPKWACWTDDPEDILFY